MPVGFPEPIEYKCVSLRFLRTGNPIPPLWQCFPKSTWYRRQSILMIPLLVDVPGGKLSKSKVFGQTIVQILGQGGSLRTQESKKEQHSFCQYYIEQISHNCNSWKKTVSHIHWMSWSKNQPMQDVCPLSWPLSLVPRQTTDRFPHKIKMKMLSLRNH